MADTSTKPYLIRALYEWCCDNGYTPYLAVAVDRRARVPRQHVKNGEIVMNVSPLATNRLELGNEFISFQARFGGVAQDIAFPVDSVSAIYARETGHGMAFEVTREPDDAPMPAPAPPAPRPVTAIGSGNRGGHLVSVDTGSDGHGESGAGEGETAGGAGGASDSNGGVVPAGGEVIAFRPASSSRRSAPADRKASPGNGVSEPDTTTTALRDGAAPGADADAASSPDERSVPVKPPRSGRRSAKPASRDAAEEGAKATSDVAAAPGSGAGGPSPDDDGGSGGGSSTRRGRSRLTRVK